MATAYEISSGNGYGLRNKLRQWLRPQILVRMEKQIAKVVVTPQSVGWGSVEVEEVVELLEAVEEEVVLVVVVVLEEAVNIKTNKHYKNKIEIIQLTLHTKQ